MAKDDYKRPTPVDGADYRWFCEKDLRWYTDVWNIRYNEFTHTIDDTGWRRVDKWAALPKNIDNPELTRQ